MYWFGILVSVNVSACRFTMLSSFTAEGNDIDDDNDDDDCPQISFEMDGSEKQDAK